MKLGVESRPGPNNRGIMVEDIDFADTVDMNPTYSSVVDAIEAGTGYVAECWLNAISEDR